MLVSRVGSTPLLEALCIDYNSLKQLTAAPDQTWTGVFPFC